MRDLHRGEGDPAGRRQPQGARPVRRRGRRGPLRRRGLAVGGGRESDGAPLRGARRAVRACSFVRMGAIPGEARPRATGSSRPSRASTGTGATSIPGSVPTSRRRPEGRRTASVKPLAPRARRREALGDPRGLRRARTGCPTRSGSRSASRASARREYVVDAALEAAAARAAPATRRTAATRACARRSPRRSRASTATRSTRTRSSSRRAR